MELGTGTPGGTPERPAVFFADGAEFGRWLEANHATADELWMGLWKRDSGRTGIAWPEAVREAPNESHQLTTTVHESSKGSASGNGATAAER